MAVREVSILELEKSRTSTIWAVNNSKLSSIAQLGEIYAAIPKLRGEGYDNLLIPQSWLPCELTEQIPAEQLLASTEFRRLVSKRLVVLIDDKSAQNLNNQPSADRERRKLALKQDQVSAAGVSSTINKSIVEIRNADGEVSEPEQIVTFGPTDDPSPRDIQVSAKFKAWAEKLENMDDDDAKSEIRSSQSIKRTEAQYLLSVLTDKPTTTKMLKRAISK